MLLGEAIDGAVENAALVLFRRGHRWGLNQARAFPNQLRDGFVERQEFASMVVAWAKAS
jgi:hypothetical protein